MLEYYKERKEPASAPSKQSAPAWTKLIGEVEPLRARGAAAAAAAN